MHCVDNIFAGHNRRRKLDAHDSVGRRAPPAHDILRCHAARQNPQPLRQGRRRVRQRVTSCLKDVHCHDFLCEFINVRAFLIQITDGEISRQSFDEF